MKYNLIFREKRKKISFFTNLNYLLKLTSFFDFADFQLLKFFKTLFISEKSGTNKFFISILLKNFFISKKIEKSKKIQKLNIPTLFQCSSFLKKCMFFIKYELKIPVITLSHFFLLCHQRIFKNIRLKKINTFSKKNLTNSILFLKNYFSFFKELLKKNMRLYIYILIKISRNFQYNISNIYKLRSYFFRNLLHYKLQTYLKERVVYIYIYNKTSE